MLLSLLASMQLRPMDGAASAPISVDQGPTLPSLPSPDHQHNSTDPSVTLPALPRSNSSVTLPVLPPALSGSKNTSTDLSSSTPAAGGSSHLTVIAVLAVFVTVTALSLLWLLVYLIRRQQRQIERLEKQPADGRNSSSSGMALWSKDLGLLQSPARNPLRRWLKDSSTFRRFTYSEIQKATDDFSSVIGKGGFGTVYKARFVVASGPPQKNKARRRELANDVELVAAVKRMSRVSRQREREFCKEMEFLGRLHHRHLVTLRGFCITRTERFLVYEYMENGSLNEHLQGHSKSPLDWQTRIQIAIDVAAALEYLHFFCDPPLCHRDIKSSNILLDQNFAAKVADFGLAHATSPAALASAGTYDQSTDVRGTPGYLDPEYVTTRQLTVKSDIYSYGVLLLELVTGRGAVQDKRNLVAWAQPYLSAGPAKLEQMVDPELQQSEHGGGYDPEELRSLASLIKMCTHREGKMRPTIRQVLSFLYERLDKDSANIALQRASMGTGPTITCTRTSSSSSTVLHNPNANSNIEHGNNVAEPGAVLMATNSSKGYRFDTASLLSQARLSS